MRLPETVGEVESSPFNQLLYYFITIEWDYFNQFYNPDKVTESKYGEKPAHPACVALKE